MTFMTSNVILSPVFTGRLFLDNLFVFRYDEQAKMVHDLNNVLQTIRDRLKECQQWDVQHQVLDIL